MVEARDESEDGQASHAVFGLGQAITKNVLRHECVCVPDTGCSLASASAVAAAAALGLLVSETIIFATCIIVQLPH